MAAVQIINKNDKKTLDRLLSQKHYLLADMKELIGDQKIDLKIAQFSEVDQDPFLKTIYPGSLLLYTKPHG